MSHFDRSRSKGSAPSSIFLNVVTLLVSQSSGWSKASALASVLSIVVTLLVSVEMSALKLPLFWKSAFMSSTCDTSQPEIGPCVASAVVTSVIAAASVARSSKMPGQIPFTQLVGPAPAT